MKQDKKYNAIKHGVLAKEIQLSRKEVRSYNRLGKLLVEELSPKTIVEALLAEQIIVNYWRLKKFLKLENELFVFAGTSKLKFLGSDFIENFADFIKSNTSFDLLSRYNASILRSFYRSLNEYRNLKKQGFIDEKEV